MGYFVSFSFSSDGMYLACAIRKHHSLTLLLEGCCVCLSFVLCGCYCFNFGANPRGGRRGLLDSLRGQLTGYTGTENGGREEEV